MEKNSFVLMEEKSLHTYKSDEYGFTFEYPLTWSLVEDTVAAETDYLQEARSFVAIFPTENRQDHSARVDVYDVPLVTVQRDNPFLQSMVYTTSTVNGIDWTRAESTDQYAEGFLDYFLERNGMTYHISGLDDLTMQIVSTFAFAR